MQTRRLKIAFTLLLGTMTFGTLGYYFCEDMTLFESFYMTIITISTVGFSEIKPLSTLGRVITIMIISTGITIGAYSIGLILRMFVEGELRKTFGRRKLEKQISALKEHYIICGYGRIGSLICEELLEHEIKFVVIENDLAAIGKLEVAGHLYLAMDASSEEALLAAGIERAKGIVTAVRSDADNVFITLTARGLSPDIFVLSRASNEKNVIKLKRAGATRVVSPYQIGGRRMAQLLIRPTVVDFLDMTTMDKQLGLAMEEARVNKSSYLTGKNLIDSKLRQDFGVIIVAIKKHNGEMIFNPLPTETLEADDVIVVIGKKADVRRMNIVL